VGVGRSLIANPDWANRVREGEFDQLEPYDKALLRDLV